MGKELTEFIQALSQVLWDYEPLDDTDLWKAVQKALVKENKKRMEDAIKKGD